MRAHRAGGRLWRLQCRAVVEADPRPGGGRRPAVRIALDNCLVSDGVGVASRVGPSIGSGDLPLIVDSALVSGRR
jgi:hypothetical protein